MRLPKIRAAMAATSWSARTAKPGCRCSPPAPRSRCGRRAETACRARHCSRVVSVPSLELLLEQPEAREKAVIGNAPVKVAIEAAVRWGWDVVIGHDGIFIGMHGFGESGPAKDLFKHFGITAEAAVNAVLKRLG